jgi:hypothetical protein
VTYSFSQTGDVPSEARFVELVDTLQPSVSVWLDETEIPLEFVQFIRYDPDFVWGRYRGDVSAFAGHTATLKIVGGTAANPYADGVFDAIQFVPEPSTIGLAFCGAVLTSLVVIRRSRKCLRQRGT